MAPSSSQVPKTIAFDLYNVWIVNGSATSAQVALNAPAPQHFDSAEVASGALFRIYGRNLYVNGKTPIGHADRRADQGAAQSNRCRRQQRRLLPRRWPLHPESSPAMSTAPASRTAMRRRR